MSINAGSIHSVSISGTTATINVTPATDAAYALTQVLYKRFGSSDWTLGLTSVGTQGVAGDISQTGITELYLYQFAVLTADSSGRYSLPSNLVSAKNIVAAAESALFLENAKVIISNSATFQTWTNTTTAEAAKLRIYDRELSTILEESPKFPLCVIDYEDGLSSVKYDNVNFLTNANISVIFVDSCSSDRDRDEAAISRNFLAKSEKVKFDVEQLESVDAYLIVKSITMIKGASIFSVEDTEQGTEDLIAVQYSFETGA